MEMIKEKYDSVIVGGGLTGLTAAVYLARAGKSVLLLEKEKLGGFAQTTDMNGVKFNLGPRAMYEGGSALHILRELDCLPDGGYASKKGMMGVLNGKLVHVPNDLTADENEEWIKIMGGLRNVDIHSIQSVSVRKWSETNIRHEQVRLLFYAMCRQWCYNDDIDSISCGFAIQQGVFAGQGVRYVEEGWQTAVDALRNKAVEAGATLVTNMKAEQVLVESGSVTGLELAHNEIVQASSILMAAGPNESCRLVKGSEQLSIGRWRDECQPLYAACLDIALRRPPYSERMFVLGLDKPLYYSNHSVSVKLSEDGSHVLHLMKYIGDLTQHDAQEDENELRSFLNLIQPGWESEVATMRYTPNVLVAYDSRPVLRQGCGPAPSPIVPEIKGLFVAGDWVGHEGRLADAALASAKSAAMSVINDA